MEFNIKAVLKKTEMKSFSEIVDIIQSFWPLPDSFSRCPLMGKKTFKSRGKWRRNCRKKRGKLFMYSFISCPHRRKKSRSIFVSQQQKVLGFVSSHLSSTTRKSVRGKSHEKEDSKLKNESYKNRRSLVNPFQGKNETESSTIHRWKKKTVKILQVPQKKKSFAYVCNFAFAFRPSRHCWKRKDRGNKNMHKDFLCVCLRKKKDEKGWQRKDRQTNYVRKGDGNDLVPSAD